jgi:hypothetical protein
MSICYITVYKAEEDGERLVEIAYGRTFKDTFTVKDGDSIELEIE